MGRIHWLDDGFMLHNFRPRGWTSRIINSGKRITTTWNQGADLSHALDALFRAGYSCLSTPLITEFVPVFV